MTKQSFSEICVKFFKKTIENTKTILNLNCISLHIISYFKKYLNLKKIFLFIKNIFSNQTTLKTV